MLALAFGLYAWWRSGALDGWLPEPFVQPDGEAAFARWLEEEPERGDAFLALERFLEDEGVADIVPAWQLARVDAFYAARCDISPFAIPPEDLWRNVVPALRLVRDEVVPVTGPVQVLSSWRSPATNVCARGASRSNHLDFAALDLVTQDRRRGADFYALLCEMQQAAGADSGMGLGAYIDPADPGAASGRFHIDAEGFRRWGGDYTSRTDPCPALARPAP